jgi:hypothetical protein
MDCHKATEQDSGKRPTCPQWGFLGLAIRVDLTDAFGTYTCYNPFVGCGSLVSRPHQTENHGRIMSQFEFSLSFDSGNPTSCARFSARR